MHLQSEKIILEIDGHGQILRLESVKTGRNYLAKGGCPLFRVTVVETFEGQILPGLLRLTPETAKKVETEEAGDRLVLTFLSLEGFDLNVIAEITLSGSEVQWRLRVENYTDFAIREIEYPWFLLRTPLGASPETERILLPKQDGILLGNPALHPWHKNAQGLDEERYWYPGKGRDRPLNLSMQMTAYYDREEGLLVYTADPSGSPKRFGPIRTPEGALDFAPVHLRPEIAGLDFSLEYPVVTRLFEGDWQQAALAYGEWSRTAPWCSRTVRERKEIPDWIRCGAFFLSFRLRYQEGGEAFLDRVPAFVESWKKRLGLQMPVVAMMCGWEKVGEWAGPDYFPPYGGDARFRRMCAALKADGNRAFPFGLSGLKLLMRRHQPLSGEGPHLGIDYDARKTFREKWRHSAALDPNGVPYYESDLDAWDGVHAYACAATEQAMDQICGASLKMLQDYGVVVEQADQVLGGGTSCCYSTEHGHPPGYGLWQVEALQRIYDETRARCKAVDPDFILSEEWISEPYIQHLDVYHARNYDKPQGGLESVPVFSFLYHDYLPCYAGDWTPMLPGYESGVHYHGWNFVCGNLPAGSPLDMLGEMGNHPAEDADPKIAEMARNACAAFAQNTRFLVEGRMLPSAPLDVPSLRLMIKGLDFSWDRAAAVVPGVLHAFWESPDGERACALSNITEERQTVKLPLASFTESGQVALTRNGGGTEGYLLQNGMLTVTLEPRDAVMVLL